MSAVQRALNIEMPAQRAENQVAGVGRVSRCGEPIWAVEESVERLPRTPPDALPLEITLVAFLYNYR